MKGDVHKHIFFNPFMCVFRVETALSMHTQNFQSTPCVFLLHHVGKWKLLSTIVHTMILLRPAA